MMLIEARNLSKSFAGRPAVQDVSFKVPASTIVGLLGSNGAGKSTTLRMLSGTLLPDGGNVEIAGIDIGRDRQRAQARLGYLPEAANGFASLTVGEFLLFAAEGRGQPAKSARRAAERVIDVLHLADAANRPLADLSKGWRQRAWLAQALIHDPPVLILDEPTDGLDPRQKVELRGFLRDLSRDRAILMSTHILEEAEELCDRVIVMNEGRVAADADVRELTGQDGRLAAAVLRLTEPRERSSQVVAA